MTFLQLNEDDVHASPLHGRLVFLLASPESGAELLLEALGRLPGVAIGRVPTHLFAQGGAMMFDKWTAGEYTTRPQGIAELVDEQVFFAGVRKLADVVLGAIAPEGADRIVEYSFGHIFHTGVITSIYPEAHLVHVVRDGRQVVTRLATPLHRWLARDAARRWREDQEALLEREGLANLHVVRVEDLVAD